LREKEEEEEEECWFGDEGLSRNAFTRTRLKMGDGAESRNGANGDGDLDEGGWCTEYFDWVPG
jgi:hypothetical protein